MERDINYKFIKKQSSNRIRLNNTEKKILSTAQHQSCTVCSKHTAAAEIKQCEPRLKLRWTLSILVSRTNCPSAALHELLHSIAHELLARKQNILCYNLSPQCCLRPTPLTWYFILSTELLTLKTKGRSCEQPGTLYLCFEDEIFSSRSSVRTESEKLLLKEHPAVVSRCWWLITKMRLIRMLKEVWDRGWVGFFIIQIISTEKFT